MTNRQKYTEADVVCDLYFKLRERGYIPKMEYKLSKGSGRADMAFVNKANNVVLIVEVKNRNGDIPNKMYCQEDLKTYLGLPQIYKYLLEGCPVFKVCNMDKTEEAADTIINYLSSLTSSEESVEERKESTILNKYESGYTFV